ncbi:cytochrome P450 [Streptomyces flavidovirens]|uniref:Cytochrome P450 n=1 Tax=Streptomyces flavidovirens TaxID=67298 RepID=A0ABW6RMP3_9ACTN
MSTVDLFDQGYVLDPFPVWDGLRENAPVHYEPDTGLWLVSRYDDVRAILLDTDTFLPDNAMDAIGRFSVPTLRVLARARFALPPTLASNGGESHAGYRRIMTGLLGARAVTAAVPMIERVTGECLDQLEERLDADGVCDLATTLARDVPLRVLLRILGLEQAADVGIDTLARWSDASLELFWGRPDAGRQRELAGEAADFYSWLRELVTEPGPAADTLLGALAAHRLPDGEPLGVAESAAVLYFMLIAGQATTRQMMSIMYRRALGEPALWRRFAEEPGSVEPWTEEMLRREPPITTWRRVTGRPVTLRGVDIPAGAPLLLMLASTGSDPDVFENPEQLCPHRSNRRSHLSFGVGRHRCSGAELARTEAGVMLRMTAARLPGLRLADTSTAPEMLGLLSFRAPLSVLVERAAPHPGEG